MYRLEKSELIMEDDILKCPVCDYIDNNPTPKNRNERRRMQRDMEKMFGPAYFFHMELAPLLNRCLEIDARIEEENE
jgi:hypothetical protein